jgi:hypothetical protein
LLACQIQLRPGPRRLKAAVGLLCALSALAWSAQGRAQELDVIPSAVASVAATSNRDLLPRGQENAQLQLRTTGSLWVLGRGQTTQWQGQYRLVLLVPLATASDVANPTELDAAGSPETLHSLRLTGTWHTWERLEFGSELDLNAGDRTPLAVVPVSAAQSPQSPAQQAGGQIVVQRSRYLQAGGALSAQASLSQRDALELRLGGSWRRNYTPALISGADAATEALAASQEDYRDTSTLSARLGWRRDLSETLQHTLEGELQRAINDLAPDAYSVAARSRARWRLGQRLALDGLIGGVLFIPDGADRDFEAGEQGFSSQTAWSTQLGVGATYSGQGWVTGLRYGRDIINAEALGNSLLVDAASAELLYFYKREAALRLTANTALSRPILAQGGEQTPSVWTSGVGAGAVVHLVDWLNLDLSYTFQHQQGLGGQDQGALASLGAPGQDVVVHTLLVGLSARTNLTRLLDQPEAGQP